MRDDKNYPKIVHIDFSDHYPQRYYQCAQKEFDHLAEVAHKQCGSVECDPVAILLQEDKAHDRYLSDDEVTDIPCYTAYC